MILAAGLGTRLRPLTDTLPKALVPVAGEPMLGRVARRLVAAGADRLVINLHAHAAQIRAYVAAQRHFGVEVCFSDEPEAPLDTGGGLLHARPCFRGDAPFFLHNADILTDLDLAALYRQHVASGALATLAVRPAATDRYLLADAAGLVGYAAGGAEHHARPATNARRVDFCGVQVASPALFERLTETGTFSIIDVYFRLVRAGQAVATYDAAGARWIDIGTHERLEAAHRLAAHL